MIRGMKAGLRAIESGDSTAYYAWINDQETNQWRGLHHPTSLEESELWIEKNRQRSPEKLSLSIVTNDGILIGFIGLQNICARSRRAELWIYIGSKEHWGKGFGEDAVRTICQYAFVEMNLFRIWLECNPDFTNVVRCYEKVGFKREGILRKAYYRNGEFRDTCILGLLKDELIQTGGKDE